MTFLALILHEMLFTFYCLIQNIYIAWKLIKTLFLILENLIIRFMRWKCP